MSIYVCVVALWFMAIALFLKLHQKSRGSLLYAKWLYRPGARQYFARYTETSTSGMDPSDRSRDVRVKSRSPPTSETRSTVRNGREAAKTGSQPQASSIMRRRISASRAQNSGSNLSDIWWPNGLIRRLYIYAAFAIARAVSSRSFRLLPK